MAGSGGPSACGFGSPMFGPARVFVTAYDPAVRHDLHGITVAEDPYAACEGAEVLLVLTEWDEFKWLDLDKVAEQMVSKKVVDARNLLDRNALLRRGFELRGIGRN